MQRYFNFIICLLITMLGVTSSFNVNAADYGFDWHAPFPDGETYDGGGNGYYYGQSGGHSGTSLYCIDFNQGGGSDDLGNPVVAIAGGIVVADQDQNIDGYHTVYPDDIAIEHIDGYYSLYMHLNSNVVAVGEEVRAGQVVGYIGGQTGFGPHLHFCIFDSEGDSVMPTPMDGTRYEAGDAGNDVTSNNREVTEAAHNAIVDKQDELYALGLISNQRNYAHWYGGDDATDTSFVVKDWNSDGAWWTNDDNWIAITYNNRDDNDGRAYVLRHGFWDTYRNNGGPNVFGAPLGDEMDLSRTDYTPHDSYWGTNKTGAISSNCGSTDTFSSVQRFEEATLCWYEGQACLADTEDAGSDYLQYCYELTDDALHQPASHMPTLVTNTPISDYDTFMATAGLDHVDGEHFVGTHEQLIPSGSDFGHFTLSLEAGNWMQYSWTNYACIMANSVDHTEVIFSFDHTFTSLGLSTYNLDLAAEACGYTGTDGTGDLVECYDLLTDNVTDTYQGLIFSDPVQSVVLTSSAADDSFCFQALNGEPDDNNNGVGVTLDLDEQMGWEGPEDQYLFIDTDHDGMQDPCIRRAAMILCDEDLDGYPDHSFSYGDGISATYFSTGNGVAVVFNYGTFYIDDNADGGTDRTYSYGVSSDAGHYFGNGGALAIQRSTRYFVVDNNAAGGEEWYYAFGWGLSNQHYYLAHFNGDGEIDLTFRQGNLFTVDQTHEGGDDFSFTYGWGDTDDYYFADLTGDGQDELMVRRGSTFYVLNNSSIPRSCSTCSNSHNWSFSYGNGL